MTDAPPLGPLPGPPMPRRRQAAIIFVFITIVIDILAMGIIIPVFPRLVLQFQGGDTASAVAITGYFSIAFALAQFFFSPVLGGLSDRYGRRPVLLITVFGHGLDFVMMALAPSLWWLFAGRVISGLTAASFSTANAYIADITPPEKRAQSFGMMGAAFGLGFIIGPALGGIAGELDPRLPFWLAAALCLMNAAYGYFVLPESLPLDKRSAFNWRKANPIGSLGFLREHGEVFWLASISFIFNLAFWVVPATMVLYCGHRYGWTELDVGLSMACVGAGNLVVQLGLIRHAVRLLGERLAVRVGLVFGAIGMTIYGLAPTGLIFLVGIPFLSLAGFMGPSLQSLMTQRVGVTEQGKLQGALASLIGVTGMIGPLMFSQIFAWAIGPAAAHTPEGLAFFVSSGLILFALLVAWLATRSGTDSRKPGIEAPAR